MIQNQGSRAALRAKADDAEIGVDRRDQPGDRAFGRTDGEGAEGRREQCERHDGMRLTVRTDRSAPALLLQKSSSINQIALISDQR
ncbi:hypothetical protein [Burkholderia multivorans]|uniref:hypothetical protein n=1 Tax=Burkholderia multivorans TaxID=87883 RepID=UPI0018C73460|nr:hypothetical protein [Burkholderia multivorans]